MIGRSATASSFPRSEILERRQSLRHTLSATGTVIIDAESRHPKHLEVLVLNVSLNGVAFRSPVSFDEQASHIVRIGAGPLHLSGSFQVIRCSRRRDGLYDVGARFA